MKGVVAYLVEDDSNIIVTFDDVNCSNTVELTSWEKLVVYTSSIFPAEDMTNLNLSKDQFAEIGEDLVIRLLALNGKIK